MSVNFDAGIYGALVAHAPLTALLAEYDGAPAVFTVRPVPSDADRPYVVTEGPLGDDNVDGLTSLRREERREVFVFADNTGSDVLVRSITEQVRAALHRARLTVPGAAHVLTVVEGAAVAPTDDSLVGRVVRVRTLVKEDQ